MVYRETESLIFIKIVRKLSNALFGDGWLFLAPYAVTYFVCLLIKVPVVVTVTCFQILHGVMALFLSFFILLNSQRIKQLAICVSLFAFFFLIGAYLEFPGDPWEYVSHIFQFQTLEYLHEGRSIWRFPYFWAWTIADLLPFSFHRVFLDGLHAFWNTLLVLQIYFLGRAFGFEWKHSVFQTALAYLTFGFGNISYFRYLGISSSLVGFLVVIRVIILVRKKESLVNAWIRYLAALILIGLSHPQGFIHLFIFGMAHNVSYLKAKIAGRRNVLTGFIFLNIGVLILIFGFSDKIDPALAGLRGFAEGLKNEGIWFLRNLNVINQTLGGVGILNLYLAFRYRKRFADLFRITVAPIALLLVPVFWVAYLAMSGHVSLIHRIFYIIPTSFFVGIWVREIWQSKPRAPKVSGTALLLGLLIFYPRFPIYGRAYNAFERPAPSLALEHYDELGQWLKVHGVIEAAACLPESDPITSWYIAANFGLRNRHSASQLADETSWHDQALARARLENLDCGVIIADPLEPKLPFSRTADILHHWPREVASVAYYMPENIISIAQSVFLARGWHHYSVGRYFHIWLPNPVETRKLGKE